ncbi:MAG: DUF4157 domain-containing protein, partial [Proteobacteria bacterium]|nr:DUF4157 domain-containing protein [Pseudomonadota bacterium]
MTRHRHDKRQNATPDTTKPVSRHVVAQGKRMLTDKLAAPTSSPDEVVQRERETSPQLPQSEQTGLIEDWTDVALRPDLYQSPLLRASPDEIGTSAPPYYGPIQAKRGPQRPVRQGEVASPESGSGSKLPTAVQEKMESAFARDFSAVRVHEGPQAQAMGAKAYTQGTDIFFGLGEYDPHSQAGQELLGHELTHVVQQVQGHVSATTQAKGVAINDDESLERQADEMGARAARGEQVGIVGGPTLRSAHGTVRQRQAATDPRGASDSPEAIAEAIYDAFHGSMFSEDEEGALGQIRGRGRATLQAVRQIYLSRYDRELEDDFRSYCNASQSAQALAILWPALSVIERLETNLGMLDDNEDGMMQVLRTATRAELNQVADEPRLTELLSELDDDQHYEARKLVWPGDIMDHVVWRIRNARGWLNDDESSVYNAVLDLSPGQRRELWQNRGSLLSFLNDAEQTSLRRMCIGDQGQVITEAQALDVRMELATTGLGTDDEGVAKAVERAGALAREEDQIAHTLETGQAPDGRELTAQQRAELLARQQELGGVRETLLRTDRGEEGALDETSFLGRLHGDIGNDEFATYGESMGVTPYDVAKQQILDAVGIINDDEEAINHAFRDLRAPIAVPEGRTVSDLTPAELRQLQAQANADMRSRLRQDPDLDHVWAYLNQAELAEVDDYASGDSYRIAIRELEDAYEGFDTDEARIFRIVVRMSSEDRQRMRSEVPDIYCRLMVGGGLNRDEKQLLDDVFVTGRLPADRAFDVSMGGWGDGTHEEMLNDALDRMADEERRAYRLGYFLHNEGRNPDELDERQVHALETYRSLRERMEGELDDEELDKSMERLLGVPSAEEILSPEGRSMAAAIMSHRHKERLELSGGLADALTSNDETAEQAAMIFDAQYRQATAEGDIGLAEFMALAGL